MAQATKDTNPKVEYPYEITTTRDQMNVGPDGRLVAIKVVFYKTLWGDTGHIEIPKADFTEANVRHLIEPEIMELLKLRGF